MLVDESPDDCLPKTIVCLDISRLALIAWNISNHACCYVQIDMINYVPKNAVLNLDFVYL